MAIHFTAPYLISPLHEIKITLIGAGGNGSQMLSSLARINTALKKIGKTGLHVTVYDADTVSEANIGRQLFSEAEIGINKAIALVSRFNRFYGTDWEAIPRRFKATENRVLGNIVVTCVDNISTRMEVAKLFKRQEKYHHADEDTCWYWLDMGNARICGQAILGSLPIQQPRPRGIKVCDRLPLSSEELDLKNVKESDSGPSCSLAEALTKQDLFINSVLAQASASLLWQLLTNPNGLDFRGFYLNLETMRMTPIPID